MNKYLMSIDHFFSSPYTFTVEAENKADAMDKAKEFVNRDQHFIGGNYDKSTLRVVKKIQSKKQKG